MIKTASSLDSLFSRENGAFGCDGVYAYSYNNGYLFYFSDTVTTKKKDGKLVDFKLCHNSFLFVDREFSSSIPYLKEGSILSPNDNDGSYYWLMDGYLEKNELYVFALIVKDGSPFSLLRSDLLRVSLSPFGEVLRYERIASFPKEVIYGSALIKGGDYFYVFCYSNEAKKKTFLARSDSLENPRFSFLQKNGEYGADYENAFVLCDFLGAENKICKYGERYWMAYSPYGINKEIRLTSFLKLGDPIKEGKLIYECPEMKGEDICYNAKIQPAFSKGGNLIISYHTNSLNEARVKETYVYRPHFLEVEI